MNTRIRSRSFPAFYPFVARTLFECSPGTSFRCRRVRCQRMTRSPLATREITFPSSALTTHRMKPNCNLVFVVVALLGMLAFAPDSFAQAAPAPTANPPGQSSNSGEVIKLEAFSVTGSNIKRLDIEKVLPVTVFDAAAIEVRDAAQPSDLLTALPQVTGLPGNETATLGATARVTLSSRSGLRPNCDRRPGGCRACLSFVDCECAPRAGRARCCL